MRISPKANRALLTHAAGSLGKKAQLAPSPPSPIRIIRRENTLFSPDLLTYLLIYHYQ